MAEAKQSQENAGTADSQDQAPAPRERPRAQAPAEQTFPVSDLIARGSDFLGQPSYVVAGALHGCEDEITLDDARGRVTAWLEQPVTKEA